MIKEIKYIKYCQYIHREKAHLIPYYRYTHLNPSIGKEKRYVYAIPNKK